jgi:drug/metabolite transporter (DMT)-like permease
MSQHPSTISRVGIGDLASLVYLGAVWGGAFLFFRVASPEVGPVWTAEIRIALAGVMIGAFIGPRRLLALRPHARTLAIVGATFSAIPFSLLAFATLTLPSSLASLLMATTPLFTAIVGAVWLRHGLSPRVIAGLVLGFGAVVFLLGGSGTGAIGPATLVAFGAGLLAAFSYAIAGTYVRRSTGGIAPLDLAAGQLLAGAIVLLPVAILTGPPSMPRLDGAVSLGLMALVSTALAWPLFFRVSARTNATVASTATFIVPLFGILWGSLILGEALGPQLLVGFALVLVSLVLVLPVPASALTSRLDGFGTRVRAAWLAVTLRWAASGS